MQDDSLCSEAASSLGTDDGIADDDFLHMDTAMRSNAATDAGDATPVIAQPDFFNVPCWLHSIAPKPSTL